MRVDQQMSEDTGHIQHMLYRENPNITFRVYNHSQLGSGFDEVDCLMGLVNISSCYTMILLNT